ncbi:MAG: helix-turn-helix transcriptional regulator [Spirochaetales bacterium]|nr:helix-turn-helix transcriptional regulator [Spirochaetales bacterium]
MNKTTCDKFLEDRKQKEQFEKEYNQFLLSEFLLDAMNENHISVRKLSRDSGVSTSIIQNIRSEKSTNVTLSTVEALVKCLGYRIKFERIS